jgi:hypothetical protein
MGVCKQCRNPNNITSTNPSGTMLTSSSKWHSNVSRIVLMKNTPNGIHYLNPSKLVNGPNEVEPIDGKMSNVKKYVNYK